MVFWYQWDYQWDYLPSPAKFFFRVSTRLAMIYHHLPMGNGELGGFFQWEHQRTKFGGF
jgi:hypothetical protein